MRIGNMKVRTLSAGIFALFAFIVVCASFASSDSLADDTLQTTDGGIVYTLYEGQGGYYAEVSEYLGTEANVEIKSTIRYNEQDYPVVSIAQNCFNITNTTLDADKEKREVITSVTIQANSQLTLTSGSFSGLTNLVSITIGEGITEIPDLFCYKCGKLSNVTLPSSMISIGDSAFLYCTSLETITLNNGLVTIHDSAFNGCTSLRSVSIPNSVITIGERAFYLCENLSGVVLGTSVSALPQGVFAGTCFTTVTIPASVTQIHETSLPSTLESIMVDPNNEVYVSQDGAVYTKSNNQLYYWPSAKGGEITLSSNPGTIFTGNTAITGVTILEGVETLDAYCFYNCENLVSIQLPSTLTGLNSSSFMGCAKLSSIRLPEGLTSIPASCFRDCSSLTTIELSNVTSIGRGAFTGCTVTKVISAKEFDASKIISKGNDQVFLMLIDGEKKTTEVYEKGAASNVTAPVSSPLNMSFDGWYVDPEYQTAYNNGALNSDATLYAKYIIESYSVKFSESLEPISGLREGNVVSLNSIAKEGKIFKGWMVKDILLGAQYLVSARDANEDGNIILTASFSDPVSVESKWSLSVTGEGIEGKAFWTKSNAVGTYGMITVVPGQFEEASFATETAGAYVVPISATCSMVYSMDDADVTVTVAFSDIGNASDYEVSVVEIATKDAPGLRATVCAEEGYVDTDGSFAISYVYKVKDAESGLWVYTTSGQTAGVDDFKVPLGTEKTFYVSYDFYLAVEGAYLVYGYASYSFEDSSSGSAVTVTFSSPVIMSVSEIQAVIGKQ